MGKHNAQRPARIRGDIDFTGQVSRTKQEFRDECNINSIIRRFRLEGKFPNGKPPPSMDNYGDFSSAQDYMDAVNTLARADAQFRSLPSEVRERFDNRADKFLDFVDPGNLEQLHDWGLLNDEGQAKVKAARAARAPREEPKK